MKTLTREELEKAEKEFKYWSARRRGRMEGFKTVEEMFLAGMTKEELWEKAGLEEDCY